MPRTSPLGAPLALASLLLAACAGPVAMTAPTTQPSPATVQAHVDRARSLAGTDLQALIRLCDPQPAQRAPRGPQADENLRRLIARHAPPPMRAFDNLYYVGSDWVSAWVLQTSQGLILIDALNHEDEARELIEGGLAKLGLDARQLKYIVVTHGHGDHYGGASYLARKYGARVVASETDWHMMHTQLEFTSAVWGPVPARDISVKDGDRLTLGDTTLTLYVTPGHSPGTLSPVFDVREGGRTHKAILWGGTSFNFGNDQPRLASYAEATDRMRRLAMQLPIEVMLSNHSSFDNSIPKMKAIADAGGVGKGPNPFVSGPQVVDRALNVMGECARAQSDRFRL